MSILPLLLLWPGLLVADAARFAPDVAESAPVWLADSAGTIAPTPPAPPPTTPVPPIAPVPPTTAPADEPTSQDKLLWAGMLLVPVMVIAVLAGVFRRDSIRGPNRVGHDGAIVPLVLVTVFGGGAWLLTQMAYGAMKGAEFARTHPGQRFSTEHLDATDFAFLSVVPPALGLLVLLAGDAAARLVRRLGYALRGAASGLGWGTIAALAVLPLMWSGGLLLDLVYRSLGIQHPTEHELLGAMRGAPQHVKLMLIVGACVAAPLFEEVLFRGHLQTLLGRIFSPRPRVLPAPPLPFQRSADPHFTSPIAAAAQSVEAGFIEPPDLPPFAIVADGAMPVRSPYVPPYRAAVPFSGAVPPQRAWLAVLTTSALFALVHPLWTAPLIFLLSVCLGYVYERTGNLWVPIVLHAIFNGASTVAFLALR